MGDRLTIRQLDHLRLLADGNAHRPIKGVSSASCFMALDRKGLATCEAFQVLRWRITEAGKIALKDSPQ